MSAEREKWERVAQGLWESWWQHPAHRGSACSFLRQVTDAIEKAVAEKQAELESMTKQRDEAIKHLGQEARLHGLQQAKTAKAEAERDHWKANLCTSLHKAVAIIIEANDALGGYAPMTEFLRRPEIVPLTSKAQAKADQEGQQNPLTSSSGLC